MDSQELAKNIATIIYQDQIAKNPFAKNLVSLSECPLAYEDDELLDLALTRIPLDQIYKAAEKKFNEDPTWGEHDYCIQELVVPICDICGGETQATGAQAPTEEESKYKASVVEVYKCSTCSAIVRFPRYGSVRKLLDTRKGRCGEFANCFTFLCRAMGSRARWVWNKEDHVWTEVYSEKQNRWVHYDPSEGIFDKPLVYTDGWGKKMSYCIAFSNEGACDVTRRYVCDPAKSLPRNQCKEKVLIWTLKFITDRRRERLGLSPSDLKKLEEEDAAEQKELREYVSKSEATPTESGLGPRESGAGEWTRNRGEDGSGSR